MQLQAIIMKNFTIIISFLLATFIASFCKKDTDSSFFSLSGEFALTSGTCTPYCLIEISGDILTLQGIDYSGSSSITYVEIYTRSKDDSNKYDLTTEPGSYIKAQSETSFTFTSSIRTCRFGK